jgi:methionyl-tRNA formyltransferase
VTPKDHRSEGRTPSSVLFLGKRDDPYCTEALRFCELAFAEVSAHLGAWGDPLPPAVHEWSGDYVLSYLSRWIVPDAVLQHARVAAINFHPAPPEYPGIGCTNFALYEGASQYGVMCHHMVRHVDTGEVIAVRRFPLLEGDDVASLLRRTYAYQLVLFYEIAGYMIAGTPLPRSDERWTRPPFTRKQFEELGRITPAMSRDEVRRRIRATRYDRWKPAVELHGISFELKEDA